MGRQRAPVQINQFIGGINTEANPLSFPLNASSDELNLELNRNGTREQRFGFDVEEDYSAIDTGIAAQVSEDAARSQFRWNNAGGFTNTQIMVVQIGNYLGFHSISLDALSSSTLYSTTFGSETYTRQFDYAVVDGILVVVTGDKEVSVYQYDGTSVTESTDTLLVRDLFGVEVEINGSELTSPTNFQLRPTSITTEHCYNLRNQTFALPRVTYTDALTRVDTIKDFYDQSVTLGDANYPSNSDNVLEHLSPTASHGSSGTVNRYKRVDAYSDLPSNSLAPIGYFIIDALERGPSREAALATLYSRNSELTQYGTTSLPQDTTSGGASCVEEYAGRIWYGGFNGSLSGGDSRSPRMSSYLLFSQIVRNQDQIARCYQEADPTSATDPDLVDTDGGFIKIDGAYGISALVSLGTSLFVLARNGVWEVRGTDQNTFTATGYSVTRVSEFGCSYGKSVVEYSDTLFYWGREGIYNLAQDPTTGSWAVGNISDDRIKTLYDAISEDDKRTAIGYYDYNSLAIRWIYGVSTTGDNVANELIFNVKFQAFTKGSVTGVTGVEGPISMTGGQVFSGDPTAVVTVGGVTVTAGGEAVTVFYEDTARDPSKSFYCILLETSPTITYTFGGYKEDDYNDWNRVTEEDNLPASYLITGSISGAEGRLRKDVPYLWVHMPNEGETLSCIISARWGWSSDASTGKWNTPRQAYRLSDFDNNMSLVSTRNKMRGSGASVAFRFESDGVKPMKLYGWEFNLTAKEKE